MPFFPLVRLLLKPPGSLSFLRDSPDMKQHLQERKEVWITYLTHLDLCKFMALVHCLPRGVHGAGRCLCENAACPFWNVSDDLKVVAVTLLFTTSKKQDPRNCRLVSLNCVPRKTADQVVVETISCLTDHAWPTSVSCVVRWLAAVTGNGCSASSFYPALWHSLQSSPYHKTDEKQAGQVDSKVNRKLVWLPKLWELWSAVRSPAGGNS